MYKEINKTKDMFILVLLIVLLTQQISIWGNSKLIEHNNKMIELQSKAQKLDVKLFDATLDMFRNIANRITEEVKQNEN